MEQFINEIENHLKLTYLNKNTVKRYKSLITKFVNYVNLPKEEINIDHAREFLKYLRDTKKLSIGTVNDYRSGVKYLFEVVLDKGWNGRKIPYLKGYKPLPVAYSKKEVKQVLECTNNILFKTIFSTVYSSGLRIEEALNLKLSDIDSKRMQIHIRESKSGSARYAILSSQNYELLKKYFRDYWKKSFKSWSKDDYLFCTYAKEKPITSKTVRKELKKVFEACKITKPPKLHALRHSFSVHLLESGADLFTIKELLGHRSISSTCVYLQLVNLQSLGTKSPLDE